MKTCNLVIAFAVPFFCIVFTACKKTDATARDKIKTTIELSKLHFMLSRQQVVCGDTNHGSASVGVLTDRN